MKLINKTPHEIRVLNKDGAVAKIYKPEGTPIRITQSETELGEVDGVPFIRKQNEGVECLPPIKTGVGYIVSAILQSACPNRTDLYVPARLVRDEKGNVIGCKAFSQHQN